METKPGQAVEQGLAEIHVLVVDDDPMGTTLMEAWFRRGTRARYTVESACSLCEALERVEKGGVDVVFLDLGLPDSRGLETLRRFRQAAPATPVLVLSGWEDDTTADEALGMGARAYLVKGAVAFSQLERAVVAALDFEDS